MLRLLGQAIRRHPRTAVLALTFLALGGGGGGVYGYRLQQMHAAERALRENRLEEAKRRLEVCRRLWPWDVRVHLLKARALRLGGEVREAEAILNRCLKLRKGQQEDVQIEFLLLRVQMGEEDEVAPTLLNYADHHHPETPLLLETLAQAYLRHLRLGPALDCLDRWIRVTPDAARPYQLRGWVLERLNNYAGALKDYQRALELDPDYITARLRLVEILLEKADVDETLAHLDRLRQQAPDRPEVQARLGQVRLLQGRRADARRLLEAAEPHLPRDVPLLIDLGKLELQDDRPEKAEAYFRRALHVDPTDTAARYQLVASLQDQGRREEAEAALAQYQKDADLMRRANQLLQDEIKHPSHNPDALYELADLLARSGQERMALYWLHQVLAVNETHPAANKALAEYYEKKGDRKRAAKYRSRIRK